MRRLPKTKYRSSPVRLPSSLGALRRREVSFGSRTMTQTTIDFERSEQRANIERVSNRIAPLVYGFVKSLGAGAEFHMTELQEHVNAASPGSPESPSRILRLLRQERKIGYTVLNRSKSLYRIDLVS